MYQYNDKAPADENIAMALYAIANELNGLGKGNASSPMGAVESHTVQMSKAFGEISSSLDGIASAISEAAQQPDKD